MLAPRACAACVRRVHVPPFTSPCTLLDGSAAAVMHTPHWCRYRRMDARRTRIRAAMARASCATLRRPSASACRRDTAPAAAHVHAVGSRSCLREASRYSPAVCRRVRAPRIGPANASITSGCSGPCCICRVEERDGWFAAADIASCRPGEAVFRTPCSMRRSVTSRCAA